jgi:hypothetical protein
MIACAGSSLPLRPGGLRTPAEMLVRLLDLPAASQAVQSLVSFVLSSVSSGA